MKRVVCLMLLFVLSAVMVACTASRESEVQSDLRTESASETTEYPASETDESQPAASVQKSENSSEAHTSMKIKIAVGNAVLTAIPEENSSAEAFLALLQEEPITIHMSDYAGMEKVGPLGVDLPRNDTPLDVSAGDVILYQGNQITIYYGTNSWHFTKLAVIEDATKESLLSVLGSGDVDVTFSIAE